MVDELDRKYGKEKWKKYEEHPSEFMAISRRAIFFFELQEAGVSLKGNNCTGLICSREDSLR